MPYRDSPDVLLARIESLERMLRDTEEELHEVRGRHTRAMAVLRIIAHSKLLESVLEATKVSRDELARLAGERPSAVPPADTAPRDVPTDERKTSPKRRAVRRSSKKPGPKSRRPSRRSGRPKGDGVYVVVDPARKK